MAAQTQFRRRSRELDEGLRADSPRPAVGVNASESGAASAGRAISTPAGLLLAGHVLRDGEVIQLILKPSLWFIPLTCARFIAVVGLLMLLAWMKREMLGPWHVFMRYIEAGVFLMAGRLVGAILQWVGRLYILTDLRILCLAGVFNVEISDCPLRKVGRVQLVTSVKERFVRVGSIEITPVNDANQPWTWQMVARPREVHEKIAASVARAKQGGAP